MIRRKFIQSGLLALAAIILPINLMASNNNQFILECSGYKLILTSKFNTIYIDYIQTGVNAISGEVSMTVSVATSIRGPYRTVSAVFHKGVYTKVFNYDLDKHLVFRKVTFTKAGDYNEQIATIN